MDTSLIDEISDAALEPERWPDLLSRLSRDHDGAAAYLGHNNLERFGSGDVWTVRPWNQDWSDDRGRRAGPEGE